MAKQVKSNPFLQVTNRQFSLFLWQFPEYMRVNATQKAGYLPGFQYQSKISLVLGSADDYVSAPPELLFLYHTWHRLISSEFIARPIPLNEFREFLDYEEEWQPQNWPAAPSGYVHLTQTLESSTQADLRALPIAILPQEVRVAFQGWKNYFKEGYLINQTKPTFAEMEGFLKSNPNYARNYWRNIVLDSYPNYLKTLSLGSFDPNAIISKDEIAPFLRVAFFNYKQSLEK